MKKITPDPPETPSLSTSDSLDPAQLSKVAQHAPYDHSRNPKPANPISHIFTIAPDVDTETVLVHASETFASLSAMITDLAFELEGSRRNKALAIQQLIVLGELLVSRALDHLDTSDSAASAVIPTSAY
ncbi:DUF6124 family protein [Pseudomonas fluorescens]|uniref:DUF3077 domain-containing protein n=1 Tax=Pseudomonas fluorescens TaxID=294 RepID=A0A5E7CTF4_PSEFL|nr:DUF6124 family protein [Pseudomonas fluorescens]VVO08323.1 hypothetical protein PS691_03196 [Pseudomonas fluorescens]